MTYKFDQTVKIWGLYFIYFFNILNMSGEQNTKRDDGIHLTKWFGKLQRQVLLYKAA